MYIIIRIILNLMILAGYWIMENFFLLPLSSIIGQLVEEADKKNVRFVNVLFFGCSFCYSV